MLYDKGRYNHNRLYFTTNNKNMDPLTIMSLASIGVKAFSAAKQAKELRTQQDSLNAQKRFNELWYGAESERDYFQSDEARSALKVAQDAIKKNVGRIQGSGAITGMSDEAKVANNQTGMNALGDFTTRLAGRADQRKDRVQSIYFDRRNQLEGKQDLINAGKAQKWSNLGANSELISEAANINSMIPTAEKPGQQPTILDYTQIQKDTRERNAPAELDPSVLGRLTPKL